MRVFVELQKDGVVQSTPKSVAVQVPPPHLDADYASNLALTHAADAGITPLELAQKIVDHWQMQDVRAEAVMPGFINFHTDGGEHELPAVILNLGEKYGAGEPKGKNKRILVEYVSANPTGPLHLGHARMVALGSSMVHVMRFAGYETDSEYYVNDSGRQMRVLTISFCLRITAAQLGRELAVPPGCYQGDYLNELALAWLKQEKLPATTAEQLAKIFAAAPKKAHAEKSETEAEIDKLLVSVEQELGDSPQFKLMRDFLLQQMTEIIKQDLKMFGCDIDNWKRESEMAFGEFAEKTLERLRSTDFVYEKDKALWFAGSQLGDDKDRVLRRSNGEPTYFANDIFYHLDKYQRKYNRLVNIWGADHHGYIARVVAAMKALGNDEKKLEILLLQLVFLKNAGEQLAMSTRAGQFVSLKEFVQAVGKDAGRFMLLMQKADRSLNFDVALALSHSKDNPVYYVQYAHARLSNILVELKRRAIDMEQEKEKGLSSLNLLDDKREQKLIAVLAEFPDLIQRIAESCDVSKLTLYLRKLAGDFHAYYNAVRVLGADEKTAPRLCLCLATKQVLANGLGLLGVEAPERM